MDLGTISGGDAVQVGGIAVQSVAVAFSVYFARRTVSESSVSRREEAERFEREQELGRAARREEETRALQADAERRLDRVLVRVAEIDELTTSALAPGSDAMLRIGLAKRRLRAAIAGVAMDLPQVGHLLHDQPIFPSQAQISAAYDELEKSLRIYAVAARLPFVRDPV
jgi:hypothetical protein